MKKIIAIISAIIFITFYVKVVFEIIHETAEIEKQKAKIEVLNQQIDLLHDVTPASPFDEDSYFHLPNRKKR
jgi:hypothetical protein